MLFETLIQVALNNGGNVESYYFLASDYGLDTQAGRDAVADAIDSLIADIPGAQVYAIVLNVIEEQLRPNGAIVTRQRQVQAAPGDYTPFWDLLGPVS
ncbi:hypothetical protein SEA_SEMPERFI_8 [Mycobacterium phage SemperFi]|nr:hypothetical protein SEA_SEMPERFI_8 [Mycobacterium phage SemperFi]